MGKIQMSEVQNVVNRLVELYQPVTIYLFGSYAWGEPHEDSDIDLMMVLSDEIIVDWEFKRGIHRNLYDVHLFPMDIVVNKTTGFQKMAEHPSSLQFKIVSEGKKLYEK